MGAGHTHGSGGDGPADIGVLTRRLLWVAAGLCAVITAVALVVTWPDEEDLDTFNLGADLFEGTVQRIGECPPDVLVEGTEDIDCFVVQVAIDEGPDQGQLFELPPFFEATSEFEPGDDLILARIDGENAPFRYAFSDRNRKTSLVVLTLLFAVAVVVLGRLRGLAALVGLAASIAVLGFYTLPALLEGQSALPVACVSAAAIALVSLYTSHGLTIMTTVALLGTLAALALTVGLGVAFIEMAELTGFATEESLFIQGVGDIDVRGLLLAGLVIGALGALDDMTVTQASVVFELRRSNDRSTRARLFASAMRVGRDHVASTVNTLVLAYAGASLPLLLLFSIGELPAVDVANSEVVATEIVRTLVGSIGLVASVPLTTWLAVLVVGGPNEPAPVPRGERPPIRRGGEPIAASEHDEPSTDDPAPVPKATRASRWERLREGLDDDTD